jgi:hypothetical protein
LANSLSLNKVNVVIQFILFDYEVGLKLELDIQVSSIQELPIPFLAKTSTIWQEEQVLGFLNHLLAFMKWFSYCLYSHHLSSHGGDNFQRKTWQGNT